MHYRARESNFCLGETTVRNKVNQKFLSEKVKVGDYISSQKVFYFLVGDDKRLMIYVVVKTHSPEILMVNETEI